MRTRLTCLFLVFGFLSQGVLANAKPYSQLVLAKLNHAFSVSYELCLIAPSDVSSTGTVRAQCYDFDNENTHVQMATVLKVNQGEKTNYMTIIKGIKSKSNNQSTIYFNSRTVDRKDIFLPQVSSAKHKLGDSVKYDYWGFGSTISCQIIGIFKFDSQIKNPTGPDMSYVYFLACKNGSFFDVVSANEYMI